MLDLTKPVKFRNRPNKILHVIDSGLNEEWPIICVYKDQYQDFSHYCLHKKNGESPPIVYERSKKEDWDLVNYEDWSTEIRLLQEISSKCFTATNLTMITRIINKLKEL